MKQILKADKRLVEKAVNRLLITVFLSNFVDSAEMPKIELFDSEDNNKALAERDALLGNIVIPFTAEYLKRKYNLTNKILCVNEGELHGLHP